MFTRGPIRSHETSRYLRHRGPSLFNFRRKEALVDSFSFSPSFFVRRTHNEVSRCEKEKRKEEKGKKKKEKPLLILNRVDKRKESVSLDSGEGLEPLSQFSPLISSCLSISKFKSLLQSP